MSTEKLFMQCATLAVIALSLGALSSTTHAADDGPDILGIRTGMSPAQAYELLKGIDGTHRVTVGQATIPVLGDKLVAYGMAPESRNSGGPENMSVWLSLPPNPQQVWSVQRQFNASIHTTIDQIVDSLRQKYGPESTGTPSPTTPEMWWVFDSKGHLTDPATGKRIKKDCGNYGFVPVSIGNLPGPPASLVQATPISSQYAPNGPLQVSDIIDPTKHLDCQGWILIHAYATGGFLDHGVFNDSLFVSITDYGIQKRAAYALNQVLTGAANKQVQQDVNKAKQQSVPKF